MSLMYQFIGLFIGVLCPTYEFRVVLNPPPIQKNSYIKMFIVNISLHVHMHLSSNLRFLTKNKND
jgi:hypothetical protein